MNPSAARRPSLVGDSRIEHVSPVNTQTRHAAFQMDGFSNEGMPKHGLSSERLWFTCVDEELGM